MKNILKQVDPTHAVCFSGHRPDRLPGYSNPAAPEMQKLIVSLYEQIENAIERGKDTFINGFMAGWDVLAAEQVIAMKKQYPQIALATIMPYIVDFFIREKCWTPEWISRAKEVWSWHDMGVVLSEHYHSGIYYERNRALVLHSSELICYWDGGKGGTKYSVQYAERKRLTSHNLFHK